MQSTVFGCPLVCSCSISTTSCNGITTVPSGIPNTTTDLFLNDNQITEINVDSFQGMEALEMLSLMDNQITEINVNSFQGMASLEKLYLQGNRITNLVPNVFQPLTALTELELYENPLNCSNCEMSQLKIFFQRHISGDAGSTCHGTSIQVVDFDFTDCTAIPRSTVVTTEPISDAVTTVKTTTDVLTTVTNSPDAPIIQTTVDATTTNEPTTVTDAIASTQIIVHPTISTTQDTQLTSMTSPVTEKADNSAVTAGTVTGASVAVSVIASFVILKVCGFR